MSKLVEDMAEIINKYPMEIQILCDCGVIQTKGNPPEANKLAAQLIEKLGLVQLDTDQSTPKNNTHPYLECPDSARGWEYDPAYTAFNVAIEKMLKAKFKRVEE